MSDQQSAQMAAGVAARQTQDPQASASSQPQNTAPTTSPAQPSIGAQAGGDERRSETDGNQYKRSIYALSVPLTVVLGTARPTIAELLKLKQDSLLELDSKIDDPVDLCINDRVIARGELIETDAASGSIGVRLTEIVDISADMLQ